MNSFLISLIASIAWKAIMEGGQFTVGLLKKKLTEEKVNHISEQDCERIVDVVNQTPEAYTVNETVMKAYLETNKPLLDILSKVAQDNPSSITQYSFGSGDNVGRDKIVQTQQ